MEKVKSDGRGRIVLPKSVRDRLEVGPGDAIEFLIERDRIHVRRAFDPDAFLRWQGFLKHLAARDTDDIMEELRGRRPGDDL